MAPCSSCGRVKHASPSRGCARRGARCPTREHRSIRSAEKARRASGSAVARADEAMLKQSSTRYGPADGPRPTRDFRRTRMSRCSGNRAEGPPLADTSVASGGTALALYRSARAALTPRAGAHPPANPMANTRGGASISAYRRANTRREAPIHAISRRQYARRSADPRVSQRQYAPRSTYWRHIDAPIRAEERRSARIDAPIRAEERRSARIDPPIRAEERRSGRIARSKRRRGAVLGQIRASEGPQTSMPPPRGVARFIGDILTMCARPCGSRRLAASSSRDAWTAEARTVRTLTCHEGATNVPPL